MVREKFIIMLDENMPKAVFEQLIANGLEAVRLIDVLPEGTRDPDVLESCHQHGYALLTHDKLITKHIGDRVNDGKDHAGVFIAQNHLQGKKGIGKIVRTLSELNDEINAGDKTVADSVYNQIKYIS